MPTPMRRVSFKRAERLEYGVSDQARARASSRSAVATHLVSDGYENEYEGAGLITNDSELLGPVQLVADRLKKKVGILSSRKHPAFVLKKAAHFFKQIRQGVLGASQLPSTLSDATGTFHKPQTW